MRSTPRSARRAWSSLGGVLAVAAGLGLAPIGRADTPERATVDLRVAALILSGQQGGAIPMAVAAMARPAAGGEANVAVVVEIDGPGFLAGVLGGEVPADPVALEVYVYALDRDGLEVHDQATRRLTVDWQLHRDLLATGLKVTAGLRLPAGASQVRVLARHGDALGLRGTRVTLPDAAGLAPRVVAFSFPDPLEWLEMALDEAPARRGGTAARNLGGEKQPAALPILRVGDGAEARLLVRRAPPDPWSVRAIWSADGTEEVVERHAMVAAESTIAARNRDAGYRTATLSFDVPELPAGRYRLSAQLRFLADGGGAPGSQVLATASDPVTVFVDQRPVERAGAKDGAGVDAAAVDVLPRKAARKIASRYLEILGRLAAGERAGALADLRALESGAVESLAEVAPSVLEQSQTRAFLGLPEEVWGAALPVLLFHADAARDGSRNVSGRRRVDLRQHAIRMTVAFAGAYARRLATGAAREEAAWVLSGLAGDFLERGLVGPAEALLERALELRGDAAGALLTLAAIHEKSGRPQAAAAFLEKLVEHHPEHPEGRLRLALNRRRLGAEAAAQDLLLALLDEEPGWIAVVAHQELARAATDGGALDDARAWVRRGLERWPRHPSLTLQLAYLLEAAGDRRAATELLAGAETYRGAAIAERSRYNRWPLAAATAHREELAERARGRLGELARVLGSGR